MSNSIRSKVCIAFFILLSSCGKKTFETSDELVKYLNEQENGYKYSKTINNVKFELLYRPTDLLVAQELTDKSDKDQIAELREKYSGFMYFNLSMSHGGEELLSTVAGDRAKFGQMVNELAFAMEEKVSLYNASKDTLSMVSSIYPRMYGATAATSIMIIYPRDKKMLKDEYLNFTIGDLGLYTGEVKFKISTNSIKNDPQLSFE